MSHIVINGLCAVINAFFLILWLNAGNFKMAAVTAFFLGFSVFATRLSVKSVQDED